ncbi:MAG: chaperone modulator CbpM [Halioglobus sp.]|jgi:chaperone modulatory protein CbpM|uniref:chaperone modulator CbpM n=1 Tax=Halioglobus sp. Uisw_031 TaxID=3230977 RepID=UPI0030A1BF39|tara:strand:+ start:184 stop:486 length:303 start_codon:yes stop_codon:yes gene_type:complete
MTEIVLWVSVQELCQCGGFTEQIIVEAVDHGIAQPADGDNIADWMFDATTAHWLRKAVRLHHDLEIDWIAISMVVDLLQKNEVLEQQSRRFEQQLNRFIN